MTQAAGGVQENRGTAPVLKRAVTRSLHALDGLLHSRYRSTFKGRAGAAPKTHPSLWSSFTSGLSSVGHFFTSLPGRAVHAVKAFVKDPVGSIVSGAKTLGSWVVSGFKAAGHALLSIARSVFNFAVKAIETVWNAVSKFVQSVIVAFSNHETQVDQKIAKQDRQAQKQEQRVHEQKAYDERLLAKTVEMARQEAKSAQEAKAAASRPS